MSLGGKKPGSGKLGGKKPGPGKLGKKADPVGTAHEKRTVKKLSKLGARRQPGSGNQTGKKGDIPLDRAETILFENKTTTGVVLSLNYSDVRKITREARDDRRVPGLLLAWENVKGPYPKDWGALPLEVLERLIRAAGWEALKRESV